MRKVRRIALTGGIATGKSHVLATLAGLGVPTVDSDTLARAAVAIGTPGLAAVVARFGRRVLDSTGALDRRALADIVFADADARRDLEAIVHPEVRLAIDAWFAALDPARHPFGVAAIPLLYEAGRERDFDAVIVTLCEPDAQLRRLMDRDGLTESEARRRIDAQLPAAEKARRGDYVITTDGTAGETDAQVLDVTKELRKGAVA
jgi:dephospho-CoA kinase